MQRATTSVLSYYEYMGRDSHTVHGTRHFCGACRRGIGGVYGSACYGFPEYPEHLEAKNDTADGWAGERVSEQLEYYAFCPWCGAQFEDEWWKGKVIQNERVIDHYTNPGRHNGDAHEFQGFESAHHWLAVSSGDMVCWCDPIVEPGLMRCVVRHQDKSYDEYVVAQEALSAARDDDDQDDDEW